MRCSPKWFVEELPDLLQAIILNRTQIYASARRHITLTWPLRLALRVVPILMFLSHTITLLQAMRCQTSPQYSFMKYGSADKHVDLEFSGDGGILYWISSTLLFWQADAEACLAVGMIPSKAEVWDRTGSLSFLWPFFQSLWYVILLSSSLSFCSAHYITRHAPGRTQSLPTLVCRFVASYYPLLTGLRAS